MKGATVSLETPRAAVPGPLQFKAGVRFPTNGDVSSSLPLVALSTADASAEVHEVELVGGRPTVARCRCEATPELA